VLNISRARTLATLIGSLAVLYLFFFEYLRPARRVQIPYDLDGFHYPLMDYAFQSLRSGRFPQWDPTMYCGMPFAANTQAALFYPPTWLLFAANIGRERMSYLSLETFVFLHVALGFLFFYLWLRRRLSWLASLCGAGIFACSGYMMLQLQHLGVVIGYAWMPFGLMGIDESSDQRSWRPLWKLATASAMCFLGGYPPTWFVFAVVAGAYGLFRPHGWKIAPAVVVALGVSMLASGIQLLPAVEMTSLKEVDPRVGDGFRDPAFYLSYLIPNFYSFGLSVDVGTNPGREYLYLGAPAFAGLLFLFLPYKRARPWSVWPILAMVATAAFFFTNPLNLVLKAFQHSNLLVQICRDWYFLAAITIAAGAAAAIGLDRFLSRTARERPAWQAYAAVVALCAWGAYDLRRWMPGGDGFPSGWANATDVAVQLALFVVGIWIYRSQMRTAKTVLAAALLLFAGVEYKVYGTSKRFNASTSKTPWGGVGIPEIDAAVYDLLASSKGFRLVLDRTAPFPATMRHAGLATPQGFDPFLTAQYQELARTLGRFRTDRELDFDPANHAAMELLGVRFFITSEEGPLFQQLSASPRYRLLQPSVQYYRTFEATDAHPAYGWAGDGTTRGIEMTGWEPERRVFAVHGARGWLYLAEQWSPGWTARVDGRPAPVERWRGAFQSVAVPPGDHRVEFVYLSAALLRGAALSLAAVLGIVAFTLFQRRPSSAGR
jgi:hypothetical protein